MDSNLIFGIRPVAEAIEAGKQIEKLYIRKGAEGQLMQELKDLCMRHRLHYQEVPVEKLNRLTRGNHQGVVAQTAAIEYVQLTDILERVPEDETPLVVLFDGVTDVRNFGAIARRCADDDSRVPRRLGPQYAQGIAGGGLSGRGRHGEEPQTALRCRFPPSYGDRDGRRGYGHLERGAQTL